MNSSSDHPARILHFAPFILAASTIVAIASSIFIKPPLWAIAVAVTTGVCFGFFLLHYWRKPETWKFGLAIGILVSIQNATCHRITPVDTSIISAELWLPIFLFLSVYIIGIFLEAIS